MRKYENEIIFFIVQYTDCISASVESVAIEVWILTDQDIITPLERPQFDCILNDESKKNTGLVGRS